MRHPAFRPCNGHVGANFADRSPTVFGHSTTGPKGSTSSKRRLPNGRTSLDSGRGLYRSNVEAKRAVDLGVGFTNPRISDDMSSGCGCRLARRGPCRRPYALRNHRVMATNADLIRRLARSWYGVHLTARAAGRIAADFNRLSRGTGKAKWSAQLDDVPGTFDRNIALDARRRPIADEQ